MTTPSDPRNGASSEDASIPTLTDIVEPSASATAQPVETTSADLDWNGLTERVQASLLAGLAHQTEALYDAQLRATLKIIFDRTAEEMAAELKIALTQLTRETVARAVREEIARLRNRP